MGSSPALDLVLARLAAVLSLAAGIVHLHAASDHLDHPVLTGGFALIAAAQVALAVVLVLAPTAQVRRVGLGLQAVAIAVWAATRLTALPFVSGLESRQTVELADTVAVILEAAFIAVAGLGLALPPLAMSVPVRLGRKAFAAGAATALALTSLGVAVPHEHAHVGHLAAHGDGHGHGDGHTAAATAHAHEASDGATAHDHTGSGAAAHAHPSGHPHALTWDDAQAALAPHAHHTQHAHAAPGATERAADHPDHADHHGGEPAPRPETVLVRGEWVFGDRAAGYKLAYEPATDDRASAVRWTDPKADDHDHHANPDCVPTAGQRDYAARLLETTATALERYHNNPARALADGFLVYPIPGARMFHLFAPRRNNDGKELDPSHIESFMYAMTDDGLMAVGGMYIFAPKDQPPPNPTGCILQWHRHTDSEGLATSFDPQNPTTSVWMAHVWTYGGLDPWHGSGDGTQPHTWFFAYRHLPAVCNSKGGCV